MRSYTTGHFWQALRPLPGSVRRQAREAFRLFQQNPFHPSLHFKQIEPGRRVWSVRVGICCRPRP